MKPVSYSLAFCDDVFSMQDNILGLEHGCRRFIILDSEIEKRYKEKISTYFKHYTSDLKVVAIESGECNKSIDTFINITKELAEFDVDRRCEPVIVIGGGVLMDVGNFVASCYRRGVPHISIPTTLMGYIDASVGIKTGINFGHYKNRIGTFDAPSAVYLDRNFFYTLPQKHIVNGVGEILKIALIKNKSLFEYLEKYGRKAIDTSFLSPESMHILNQSIVDMVEELEPNLYEDNLERCVDFGHTFSLPFEMFDKNPLLHGEAVAVDIAYSSCLAFIRGITSESDLSRILSLMKRLELPTYHEGATPDILWASVLERVRHRGGHQRIPLAQGIGNCVFANDINKIEVEAALDLLKEKNFY